MMQSLTLGKAVVKNPRMGGGGGAVPQRPAELEILMDHGSELAQNTPSPPKIRTTQEGPRDFGSELGNSLHVR